MLAIAVASFFCAPLTAQERTGDSPQQASAAASTAESNAASEPSAQDANQEAPVVGKIRNFIETNPIIQKIRGDGFYPRIGGLSPGSGLAGGGGYRKHLDWAFVDLSAAISTKAYRGIDAAFGWINTTHFEVASKLTFRNNTQDDFYGLGLDTTDATRVDYGIRATDVSTGAAVRPASWLRIGGDVGYYVPEVRHGRDDNLRTIGAVFTDATAPGLAEQPHYVHDGLFAEVDTRDARGFPTRGGFYHVAYTLWNDRTLEQYNFRRMDISGSHFVPLRRNFVVALRLALSYANNAPGDRIPFFLMPYVGGGDSIRSFREFRFRDENAGVFNAEIRHKVHSMVHIAGFVDLGKVAEDWQDINPTHLKHAYGVGVRGGTDDRTYVRLDIARGDDGTRVFFKFSPSF